MTSSSRRRWHGARRWAAGVVAGAAVWAAVAPAGWLHGQTTRPAVTAAEPAERPAFAQRDFLRFVDDDVKPRLEVSVMTFRGEDGFEVDLVSAVHIADAAYFQELNRRFDGYDAVLYELVKQRGMELPAPGERQGGGGVVGGLQRGMKAMLGLSYQLDEIDYRRANFIHADMDVHEFYEAQKARGESLWTLVMNAYRQSLTAPRTRPADGEGRDGEARPVRMRPLNFAGSPAERQHAFKMLMAGMFDQLERQSLGLDGPEGSAILTDRNDAALKVLREVRAAGQHRRVALFYGAAHMPDLARKLVDIDGLKPVGTEWLTAWDLTPPATATPERP
ncbi:MAG: hypothetical protein ACK4PI_04195 [Tepidisphaerales bacterium]